MDTIGEKIGVREDLINRACALAIRAHSSSDQPFVWERSRDLGEAIFGFSGSWDAKDWFSRRPFGERKINLDLFPSIKSVGLNKAATVNEAFLQRFEAILSNSLLRNEVQKAVSEKRQLVFTGHSSAAPIAIFATLWFLETNPTQLQIGLNAPRCLTFGIPLVGDRVLSHAIRRENWSHYFTHFIMRYDIIPRIFLSPLSSIERELQPILHLFNPRSPFFGSDSISRAPEASVFFGTVMRNASSIASHVACKSMGNTNVLLEAWSNFIELSPYRPFGTHVFITENGRMVVVENSDAVLQLLFHCLQLNSEAELTEVTYRSLKEHLIYESEMRECLEMLSIDSLDRLEDLPLSAEDAGDDKVDIDTTLQDLGLSTRARLCLRAAGELEKQKVRNQLKVESNKNKIIDGLNALERYQAKCEVRKLGYYDAFKLQRDYEDFNSNVKRLELAGIWDEIMEMLKRNELPDDFEGKNEWIELGTRYRCIVEPLDIANYYRHLMNEDTGSYMGKGRPRRYKYTQKWYEHAQKMQAEPTPESCFWAEVEELCLSTNRDCFEDIKVRVLQLERNISKWVRNGQLGRDVFLSESTFVRWWKCLPPQHRSTSCIADLILG